MYMPEPDAAIIAKRPEIVDQLNRLVPAGPFGTNVITDPDGLRAYECDGLSAYRQLPMVVVLPETTVQVSEILKYCDDAG
ncbi:MAG: FAD-binding oxidoreductase, partial [Rhodospirillales bacterium]|nr:FAD-binding oxidoreductase [Rhodospirillales bacterium]